MAQAERLGIKEQQNRIILTNEKESLEHYLGTIDNLCAIILDLSISVMRRPENILVPFVITTSLLYQILLKGSTKTVGP